MDDFCLPCYAALMVSEKSDMAILGRTAFVLASARTFCYKQCLTKVLRNLGISPMTKKLLSLCLFAWLAVGVSATAQSQEEPDRFFLETVDGQKFTFLFAQRPKVLCFTSKDGNESYLSVSFYAENGSTWESLDFDRDQVKVLTFGTATSNGIDQVSAADRHVTFGMLQPGVVSISGLQEGDCLLVSSVDGKTIVNSTMSSDGQQTLDLSRHPRGIYVLSVNHRFTFKLMKP